MSDREEPKCAKVLKIGGGSSELCNEAADAPIHRRIGPGNYPHAFVPPVVLAPSLDQIAEEIAERSYGRWLAQGQEDIRTAIEVESLAILQRHFGEKQ